MKKTPNDTNCNGNFGIEPEGIYWVNLYLLLIKNKVIEQFQYSQTVKNKSETKCLSMFEQGFNVVC